MAQMKMHFHLEASSSLPGRLVMGHTTVPSPELLLSFLPSSLPLNACWQLQSVQPLTMAARCFSFKHKPCGTERIRYSGRLEEEQREAQCKLCLKQDKQLAWENRELVQLKPETTLLTFL